MLGCKKEIHTVDTTQHANLHQPISNLTKYQNGIYYSGEGVYNNLPPHIKDITHDPKNFELQLKHCIGNVDQLLVLLYAFKIFIYIEYFKTYHFV